MPWQISSAPQQKRNKWHCVFFDAVPLGQRKEYRAGIVPQIATSNGGVRGI